MSLGQLLNSLRSECDAGSNGSRLPNFFVSA
jgi:hypothetical protein